MAIDPMMLDPMLSTYKNMYEECKDKGLSGSDFDNMKSALDRMIQLGQEHSDFVAFNGQLMQENLFARFSESYGKLLTSEHKINNNGNYDDSTLLLSSVNALKQSVTHLNDAYQTAINESKEDAIEVAVLNDPSDLIHPIEELIKLGEQEGMMLPDFLRLQIERGLDKAMEGSVAARKAYVKSLEWAQAHPISPYILEKENAKIEVFDKLASAQKFGVPNWKELSYAIEDIERDFEPQIIKWNTIKRAWEDLLWDLSFWSLSYCNFAPGIEPWSMSKNPHQAVKQTQDITPGIFQQKLRLFHKYFNLSFMDIFKHPSFIWEVKYNYIGYSQEYVTFLIEKVFPNCLPFIHLESDTINERESFTKPDDRTGNPESSVPSERIRDHYDALFGEGRYASKFGAIYSSSSKAIPWNINSFKYC